MLPLGAAKVWVEEIGSREAALAAVEEEAGVRDHGRDKDVSPMGIGNPRLASSGLGVWDRAQVLRQKQNDGRLEI